MVIHFQQLNYVINFLICYGSKKNTVIMLVLQEFFVSDSCVGYTFS